jgi:hypothetical protein
MLTGCDFAAGQTTALWKKNAMKTGLALFTTLLLATSASQALAASATPEGADKITAALQSYLGKVPGVITVKPDGESYDLTLDLEPLFAKADAKQFEAHVSPLKMQLTEKGGGKWTVTQDQAVDFAVKAEAAVDMSGKIASLKGEGEFDEALGAFTSSKTDVSGISYKQDSTPAGQPPSHVEYTADSMHYETTMQPAAAAGAADGTVRLTMTNLLEKFSMPGGQGTAPVEATVSFATGTQDGTLKGLMTKPVMAAVAYLVAHPEKADLVKDQAHLKDLLRAALPLFERIDAKAVMEGMKVSTAVGEFGASRATVEAGFNGIVANGELREKLAFEGLTLPAGLVPPWAVDLAPSSLAIDMGVTDFNLAAPAGLMLDKLDLAKDPPLPATEMDQPLLAALLPKGTVTITLGPSTIVSKITEIAANGSMTTGPAAQPAGSATIAVKGLDAAMAAVQAAPPEMGLGQMLPMFMMAKGMAKPGDGGALTWKIESTPQGGVLINGIDPMKMGGGQ